VTFIPQACNGLADQIEKGELQSRDTAALVRRYVAPLIAQKADTLVLGCTHYPFVEPLIASVAASADGSVHMVDTGEPVARQLERLLAQHGLLRPDAPLQGELHAYTTGSRTALTTAFRVLLDLNPPVDEVAGHVG
jgi:glutamate racemase